MGYPMPPGAGGYDFGTIYGMADWSGGLVEAGTYAAVVETSEWGTTKAGDKGQWTVAVRFTEGQHAGHKLTSNITISPKTNDGRDNGLGVARMFTDLAALGVAVPDPKNPAVVLNGEMHGGVPFWIDPGTGQPLPKGVAEQQAAQVMIGKPCKVETIINEWDGGVNNKIRRFLPYPGGPTDWPRPQQQANPWAGQAPAQQGYGMAQPGYPQQAAYPAQPGYPQQPAPAGYPPQGYPQQPPAATAPQPWQQPQQAQAPMGITAQAAQQPSWAPQPPQPGQPQVPGAPPWAQPGVPGAGGGAEFSPQGQSGQPGITPPGYQPQQPQQPPAVPQPPWAGQAPQGQAQAQPGQAPQPPWQGTQNGAPMQPQQPGVPEQPPWAQ